MLQINEECITLTDKGKLLADYIASKLFIWAIPTIFILWKDIPLIQPEEEALPHWKKCLYNREYQFGGFSS